MWAFGRGVRVHATVGQPFSRAMSEYANETRQRWNLGRGRYCLRLFPYDHKEIDAYMYFSFKVKHSAFNVLIGERECRQPAG